MPFRAFFQKTPRISPENTGFSTSDRTMIMSRRSQILPALLCTVMLLCTGGEAAAAEGVLRSPNVCSHRQEIVIGLLDEDSRSFHMRFARQTRRYLQAALPGCTVSMRSLSDEDFRSRDKLQGVDFFMRISGVYGALRSQGARVLATMVTDRSPDTDATMAGAVVVPVDSPCQTLSELRGLRVVTTLPDDYGSYIPVLAEIAALSDKPERFFSETQFLGRSDLLEILDAVREGRADAAVIQSGVLETFVDLGILPLGDLRVIDRDAADPLQVAHTTEAYPGFLFWATHFAD